MIRISIKILSATFSLLPLIAFSADYDVSGYGDQGYVYGEVDAQSGSRDVDGYLYNDDGDEVYFTGEWSGHDEIDGYDEDGNYIELEVD